MITSRRSLFGFGAALIAAPTIVRVASIMPVSMVYDPMAIAEAKARLAERRIQHWMDCNPRLVVSETWWRTVMGGNPDRSGFIVTADRLPA